MVERHKGLRPRVQRPRARSVGRRAGRRELFARSVALLVPGLLLLVASLPDLLLSTTRQVVAVVAVVIVAAGVADLVRAMYGNPDD